jgi:NAD(P)-dependent dehydrogenase (short-subunit alcohol dehydrogenase family)
VSARSGVTAHTGAAAAGAALGATLFTGHALLLYSGQGFLRAAGFLVAVTMAAVGAGIWGGVPGPAPDGRALLRRWRAFVLAILAGGVFAALWDRSPVLRAAPLGNALATLVALAAPAYTGGMLLTALARTRGTGTTAIAVAFVGLGALGTTTLLVPRMDAAAVFFLAGAWVAASALVPGSRPNRQEAGTMMLEGKSVVVTGAGRPGQVGYAIAERCIAAGAHVLITARSGDITRTATRLGPPAVVTGVAADLTEPADLERLAAAARDRFGGLDALINVAGGLSLIKPLAETSTAEWRREIERNADTVHATSRALLPLLRESRGAIVNFASPAGLRAAKNLGAYSAAKAAVVAHTRALALEEKGNGVRVNAIAPGTIDTEQNRADSDDPEHARWVTREEIADVALFLAGDGASGISGETIHVLGDGLR